MTNTNIKNDKDKIKKIVVYTSVGIAFEVFDHDVVVDLLEPRGVRGGICVDNLFDQLKPPAWDEDFYDCLLHELYIELDELYLECFPDHLKWCLGDDYPNADIEALPEYDAASSLCLDIYGEDGLLRLREIEDDLLYKIGVAEDDAIDDILERIHHSERIGKIFDAFVEKAKSEGLLK